MTDFTTYEVILLTYFVICCLIGFLATVVIAISLYAKQDMITFYPFCATSFIWVFVIGAILALTSPILLIIFIAEKHQEKIDKRNEELKKSKQNIDLTRKESFINGMRYYN